MRIRVWNLWWGVPWIWCHKEFLACQAHIQGIIYQVIIIDRICTNSNSYLKPFEISRWHKNISCWRIFISHLNWFEHYDDFIFWIQPMILALLWSFYYVGKFRNSFDGIKGVSFDGLTSRGLERDRMNFSATGKKHANHI